MFADGDAQAASDSELAYCSVLLPAFDQTAASFDEMTDKSKNAHSIRQD